MADFTIDVYSFRNLRMECHQDPLISNYSIRNTCYPMSDSGRRRHGERDHHTAGKESGSGRPHHTGAEKHSGTSHHTKETGHKPKESSRTVVTDGDSGRSDSTAGTERGPGRSYRPGPTEGGPVSSDGLRQQFISLYKQHLLQINTEFPLLQEEYNEVRTKRRNTRMLLQHYDARLITLREGLVWCRGWIQGFQKHEFYSPVMKGIGPKMR